MKNHRLTKADAIATLLFYAGGGILVLSFAAPDKVAMLSIGLIGMAFITVSAALSFIQSDKISKERGYCDAERAARLNVSSFGNLTIIGLYVALALREIAFFIPAALCSGIFFASWFIAYLYIRDRKKMSEQFAEKMNRGN